jgi:hypothetical protein
LIGCATSICASDRLLCRLKGNVIFSLNHIDSTSQVFILMVSDEDRWSKHRRNSDRYWRQRSVPPKANTIAHSQTLNIMPPPSRNIKTLPRPHNRLIVVLLSKEQRKPLRVFHFRVTQLRSIEPDLYFRGIRLVDAVLVISTGVYAFCG